MTRTSLRTPTLAALTAAGPSEAAAWHSGLLGVVTASPSEGQGWAGLAGAAADTAKALRAEKVDDSHQRGGSGDDDDDDDAEERARLARQVVFVVWF